ncbi:hypothetical protein Vretimale_2134 [Volvox reticuliferus]|uniref:Uncharacterized protein n=1 Tax=Volvox reticuliferus TaxID=1737510 RepID=A0A8J4D971_9CHLO|nr:hypothetical protein Vretifemale_4417 [Volvox reticuliferus]GIL96296.1 hypothetical protein Vretimale_2134 [Volvox reticuliferus]
MAANSYQNTFEDHTTESIQDTFHFDSNQFLIPDEGEGAPLDYEDLFSMLNQPAAQGSWGSSGIEHPIQSTGSEVVIASSSVPQAASSPPLQSQQQQQHKQQVQRSVFKSSRDITFKRSRDGGSGRSKQHQLKELEALAAKKNEDLERLMQENDELKFRSQILEKVVQMREYQLKVLRGPPQGRPQFWGVLSTAGTQHYDAAAAGAASADVGQEARCATAGMMWQCPNAAAAAPALCGNGIPPASMAIKMASCGCLLPCSEWSLSVEDRERFRSLGKAQLMEGWKHFLSEVSVPLLVFESNDEDERAAACIRELALEATHMFKHASLLAPDTVMVASQAGCESKTSPQTNWVKHLMDREQGDHLCLLLSSS